MPLTYSAYGYADSRLADAMLGFKGELVDTLLAGYMLGMGNRLYSSSLMRFLSADRLSPFGKGWLNWYAYCSGDPVNFIDPSGATRQRPTTHRVPNLPRRKAPGLAMRVEEPPPDYVWALARTRADEQNAPTLPTYSRSPSLGQSTNSIRLDGFDTKTPITPEQFKAENKALSIQAGTIDLKIKDGPRNGNIEAFGEAIVAANLVESHIALARVALHHRRYNTAMLNSSIRNT